MCVHNTHTHLPSTHTHPFSPSQAPSPTGSQKEVRASEKRVWGAAARCGPAAAALTPIAVDPHTQRTGWLAFGSLRSFPAGQLRRLCAALHARAAALLQEHSDVVLFANYRISTVKAEVGFNKKVNRAMGSGERVIHTAERPAFLAKNRYGLPETLPLAWDAFAQAMPDSVQPMLITPAATLTTNN